LVNCAFCPAVRDVAHEATATLTDTNSIPFLAVCIVSARKGVAGISRNLGLRFRWWVTTVKGITNQRWRTTAERRMETNTTFCPKPTFDSWAGVNTLLVDASLVRWAVAVRETLRTTEGWNSNVI